MKLIYNITLRLSLVLLPLLALWATLFYFTMVDEINDEADDALENYSELIISRLLVGLELPTQNDGSNNSYSITPIDKSIAQGRQHVSYYDDQVYIPEKQETEPARVLTTIFQDKNDNFYELKVATPTFEKEDLFEAILQWILILYLVLLVLLIGLSVWVIHRSMHPLYALLRWFDGYVPGRSVAFIPNDTTIKEFRRLNQAAQHAVDRSEALFERQKQFIGNASHELQTPLAVLGNRIEWMLDYTDPTEQQVEELLKMQRTITHIVKTNKTLLLLTKIDNGQFPQSTAIEIDAIVKEQLELCHEVYATRCINCQVVWDGPLRVQMNESLASILITNLLKNAYVYTPQGGVVKVSVNSRQFTVSNDAEKSLDAEHIFDRFYQGTTQKDSTGLGLALVSAVCRYYGLDLAYRFGQQQHHFTITW